MPLFHPAVATYNINKLEGLIDDFQIIKKILFFDEEPSENIADIIKRDESNNIRTPDQMEMWPQ